MCICSCCLELVQSVTFSCRASSRRLGTPDCAAPHTRSRFDSPATSSVGLRISLVYTSRISCRHLLSIYPRCFARRRRIKPPLLSGIHPVTRLYWRSVYATSATQVGIPSGGDVSRRGFVTPERIAFGTKLRSYVNLVLCTVHAHSSSN